MKDRIVITADSYGKTTSISIPDDSDLDEVLKSFEIILKGLGYHYKGSLEITE